ncbi:hypothetical protein A9Q83_16645 [Alphaproteobacteria bacterium 46_93_T64]|nr:hypothetical protein A9Q83_16645 [Alphaproteobacteria bacterium 46_93_T64]
MGIINGNRSEAPYLPLEAFGEWGEWISQSAENCSAPKDYVAMGLLATASALIGNARWVSPWNGWKEPPILWLAAVGDPSSGKSPALDSSLGFLREFEGEMAVDYSETLRNYERDREIAKAVREGWQDDVKQAVSGGLISPEMPEKAIEPDQPVRPRLYVTDATQEAMAQLIAAHPKGLLCQRDELAGWLLNFDRYGGGGERDFWIEGYGGRSYNIDRVKHAKEPIRIPHLSLSVVGGIQPERLAEILMKGADSGFAARFLMVWPERVPPKRPEGFVVNTAYRSGLQRLRSLTMPSGPQDNLEPEVKFLSGSAADLFQEWRVENDKSETEAFGLLLSHLGKLPGIVLRLAVILEYLNWCLSNQPEPETISESSLCYAIHLVESYFKVMATRVYGDAALPGNEKSAAMLARRIKRDKPTTVNASDVRRYWKLPGLQKSEAVTSALAVLVECGWLSPSDRTGKAQRPRLDYTVNPDLYEVPS